MKLADLLEDKSEFNDEQTDSLENQLDKLLPKSVEIKGVYTRSHGRKGYIAPYTLDDGKKGYIEFDCKLADYDKIENLKIFDVTGGMKGIDQKIFTAEALLTERPASFVVYEVSHSGDEDAALEDLQKAGCKNLKVTRTDRNNEVMQVSCDLPPDVKSLEDLQKKLKVAIVT